MISFTNLPHSIYPTPLLRRERYHRDIYCIHKEERGKQHFSDLCFSYLCGRGTWGKEIIPKNKTILYSSILFYFILESEVRLRQPILNKSSRSSVNQIDQNRTDLGSSRADVSFPNFKI